MRSLFTVASILVLAPLVACGIRPAPPVPTICSELKPVTADWERRADLAGTYDLWFVARTGPQKGRTTVGRLDLQVRDSVAGLFYSPTTKRPNPTRREVYFGSAAIDLGAVGAYTEGSVSSTNPQSPGVAIVDERRPGAAPSLYLSLGSDRNRRDILIFDGAFIAAQIRSVGSGGFSGVWEAGVGPTTYSATGTFCAKRDH